jgi:predicted component of type VI protein secretion system
METEKPEKGSFLQLETFCKDKNFARVVHVLLPDPSKLAFKLGRGHEADVKISDISVSRVHAQISMTPKGFILEDNSSKFGTLLLLPSIPQEIDITNGLSIQVSRTILTFAVKQNDVINKSSPGVTQAESVNEAKTGSPISEVGSAYVKLH